MTKQTSAPKETFVGRFVERLSKLPRSDLAILKRSAGLTLADSRNAAGTFYRLYFGGANDRDEEVFFLVATLYGLNPRGFGGDFGATMRSLVAKGMSRDAVDRRMTMLLDSELDLIDGFRPGGGELAYRLRQCVKLAVSRDVGVNWAELLDDLRKWNHQGKRTQKKWARSYFSRIQLKETASSTLETPKGE